MITIVAKHFVKEDKISDFLENAKKLVEITRKEQGCIKYQLYQDITDAKILTMIEEWEDKDALDRHSVSEHFTKIVPILVGLVEKQTEMNIYKKAE